MHVTPPFQCELGPLMESHHPAYTPPRSYAGSSPNGFSFQHPSNAAARALASPHCALSPDGLLVAALVPSRIQILSVRSLETVCEVPLPPDATGPVLAFQWSPSSSRLLVAYADQVHVFSAVHDGYRATISIPALGTTKPTVVQFGASDTEVCLSSQFGRAFSVFDLISRKSVEISNPKFHHPSSAPRGFAFRPSSGHLTLLTRIAGKDIVSIHHPITRDVQRSWHPDTIDAQGLLWTPDGRWLVMWESPSQGHKTLFYTPDGRLFKVWSSPSGFLADKKDYEFGAGVKICQPSPDARRLAVGDHTCNVHILDAGAVTETSRLHHPSVVSPKDTIQVRCRYCPQERKGKEQTHGLVQHDEKTMENVPRRLTGHRSGKSRLGPDRRAPPLTRSSEPLNLYRRPLFIQVAAAPNSG